MKALTRTRNRAGLPAQLPVEIEIYVDPDGSVTFADLAEDMVSVAHSLNPDQELACDVSPDTSAANPRERHEQAPANSPDVD